MSDFTAVVTTKLTAEHLECLFGGSIGVLRVANWLDTETRTKALAGLVDDVFCPYDAAYELGGADLSSEAVLVADHGRAHGRRLGITLYEFACRNQGDEYFKRVADAVNARRKAFAKCGDLLDRVLNALNVACPHGVATAFEPGLGPYFAGVVRDVYGESRIHTDDSRQETPSYCAADVEHQLGLYVYLASPPSGGAVVVYDREVRVEDEAHRDGYGFRHSAVAGNAFVGVSPVAGDMVMFQARNLHRIESCIESDPRIMFNTFVGRLANGSVMCWS